MKCVKKYEIIKRVSDNIAADLVANEEWAYCSKKAWKMEVRDAVKIKDKVDVVVCPVIEETKKPKVQGRQRQKQLGEN